MIAIERLLLRVAVALGLGIAECLPLGSALVLGVCLGSAADGDGSMRFTRDYEARVSSADITLNRPVTRREAGMPIGTGWVGSLVWTTPSAMKFQINPTDVYASDGTSNSFIQRNSDDGFGLGYVDIRFIDFGPDVFTPGTDATASFGL